MESTCQFVICRLQHAVVYNSCMDRSPVSLKWNQFARLCSIGCTLQLCLIAACTEVLIHGDSCVLCFLIKVKICSFFRIRKEITIFNIFIFENYVARKVRFGSERVLYTGP
jgi:hypothetical protein